VREIELKYRVEDLEALLVALKSRGIELSGPVFQDDQAYAPAGWQFGDSKLGVSFLRLRTVQGCHYFTLKQPAGSAQDCLEYETQVTDRQAMHQAALHMGYRPDRPDRENSPHSRPGGLLAVHRRGQRCWQIPRT